MCIDCEYAEDMPDPDRDYRYISHPVVLTDVRDDAGISAVFEWDEVDPWVVTIDFGDQTWTIGRELLATGLHRDAGLGDVRFTGDVRHPDRRLMIRNSPDGHVVLRFDPVEVSFFVESVDRHVNPAAHPTDGNSHV